MHHERVEVVGEAAGTGREPFAVKLVDERLEAAFGVLLADRLIQRLPVGVLDAFAFAVGELGVEVPGAVNAAALAVRRRPALLDRFGQAGRAVGDDQHRRPQPAGDQIATEGLPVLEGLAHPQREGQQHPVAVLGEPPRDQHALLGPIRAHGDERRIEEQRDQPDLIEVTTPEPLEALLELLTHPRRGRLRQLPPARPAHTTTRHRASTSP